MPVKQGLIAINSAYFFQYEVEVRAYKNRETGNLKLERCTVHGWMQKWPSAYDTYKLMLSDMSQIKENDSLRVKTVRVDEENKTIYVDLIKRRFLP